MCRWSRSPSNGRSSRSPGRAARDVLQRVVDCPTSICQRRHALSGRRGPDRAAAACQARLFRISFSGELAYELALPARFGDAAIRALMEAGARLRHHALRHRGAGRHAHREGPCRRQRAQRADHGGRSRPRPDDVEQEGLYRPRHGWAARSCRSRPAALRRLQAGQQGGAASGRRPFHRARAPKLRPRTTRDS